MQPEAIPKLRVAGFAVVGLLLALLYQLLVQAIHLPTSVAGPINSLFVAVAAVSVTVALIATVDLSLVRARAWAWPLVVGLLLVVGIDLALASATAHRETAALGANSRLLSMAIDLLPVIAAGLLLIVSGQMDWTVTFDRYERFWVRIGGLGAMMPLIGGVYVDRLPLDSHQHLLLGAIRSGSTLVLFYVGLLLVRATVLSGGARAYERKVRELDAVYDFGLTARTAFNPRELPEVVLRAVAKLLDTEVALVVEPDPEAGGCLCSLYRRGPRGKRVYRYHSRSPWAALAERFGDRNPVVVVDHQRVSSGVLQRVWEPVSGSSVIVPVISRDGQPRALLIAGRFEPYAFNTAEVRSLAGFATQVGLAMEHAQLLREVVEAERPSQARTGDRPRATAQPATSPTAGTAATGHSGSLQSRRRGIGRLLRLPAAGR